MASSEAKNKTTPDLKIEDKSTIINSELCNPYESQPTSLVRAEGNRSILMAKRARSSTAKKAKKVTKSAAKKVRKAARKVRRSVGL